MIDIASIWKYLDYYSWIQKQTLVGGGDWGDLLVSLQSRI